MPKYAKPHKGTSHVRRFSHFTPVAAAVSSTSIENLSKAGSMAGRAGSTSGKEENSSEDELLLGHVQQRHRGSISSGGGKSGNS